MVLTKLIKLIKCLDKLSEFSRFEKDLKLWSKIEVRIVLL